MTLTAFLSLQSEGSEYGRITPTPKSQSGGGGAGKGEVTPLLTFIGFPLYKMFDPFAQLCLSSFL